MRLRGKSHVGNIDNANVIFVSPHGSANEHLRAGRWLNGGPNAGVERCAGRQGEINRVDVVGFPEVHERTDEVA